MKTIKIQTEQWFTNCPFHEVNMLAIKHLGIPADRMSDTHKHETSKRALARQMFMRNHQFGEEFEIIEPSNPFGKVSKRKNPTIVGDGLTGEYRFIKCRMRAPPDDIRWKMMKVIEENTQLEDAIKSWDKEAGARTMFKSTGAKHQFNFINQLEWAIKCNWIERV